MKKLMIVLAFAGFTCAANAQETVVPQMKYSVATNSFWSNWFVSAGGSFNSFYSDEEVAAVPTSPFIKERRDFGAEIAVGKWFTPGIGLRTKLSGVWGKQVWQRSVSNERKYWNLQEDVLFNLSNMICGYNETRLWNFIPYVGLGQARNMSDNVYQWNYNIGLLNNFRLSKHFSIYLDLYSTWAHHSVDGIGIGEGSQWHFKNWDKIFGASAGITYNIGKSNWSKVPDVDALMAMNKEQMDALNSSLKEQQDENARLKDMLAHQKTQAAATTVTKSELVSTTQSVFFNIGKSTIASKKDLVNVKEVAEYAKANNKKIVVTGYADSKTGSADFNKNLSQKRADAVADELVKMGVSRDNIITEAKGGVNDLSPISYNRRATVKLQ